MTTIFFLYLVAFVIVGCTCFQNNVLPPSTTPETFPFQALVKGKSTTCSGILISPEHVLTPASCVVGSTSVAVYLGFRGYPYFLDNNEPDTQIYTCNKFIVHEDYLMMNEHRHFINNIAIVTLPKAVKLTTTVQPGNLITKEEGRSLSGNIVNITGWIYSLNKPLMVAEVPLRTQDTCRVLFGQHMFMDQELCVKWPSTSKHLNLLGNAVSLNGKIIGFQTNTPYCSDDTCSQNDMVLSIVPFLDWISRYTHVVPVVPVSQCQCSNNNDVFSDKLEKLGSFIKEVQAQQQADTATLNKKLDALSNRFQEQLQINADFVTKLDEQFRSIRSEFRNSETRQNTSILGLQEAFGSARTEVTNGLSAKKLEDDLIAQRITALETKTSLEEERILKLETTLETVKNLTEINTLEIQRFSFAFEQKLEVVESKINSFKQDDEWRLRIHELDDKLSNSLKNVTALISHSIHPIEFEILNFHHTLEQDHVKASKHYEHFNQKILDVSNKNAEESSRICDRIDHIAAKVNSIEFYKQIEIENNVTSLSTAQEKLANTIKECCFLSLDN